MGRVKGRRASNDIGWSVYKVVRISFKCIKGAFSACMNRLKDSGSITGYIEVGFLPYKLTLMANLDILGMTRVDGLSCVEFSFPGLANSMITTTQLRFLGEFRRQPIISCFLRLCN